MSIPSSWRWSCGVAEWISSSGAEIMQGQAPDRRDTSSAPTAAMHVSRVWNCSKWNVQYTEKAGSKACYYSFHTLQVVSTRIPHWDTCLQNLLRVWTLHSEHQQTWLTCLTAASDNSSSGLVDDGHFGTNLGNHHQCCGLEELVTAGYIYLDTSHHKTEAALPPGPIFRTCCRAEPLLHCSQWEDVMCVCCAVCSAQLAHDDVFLGVFLDYMNPPSFPSSRSSVTSPGFRSWSNEAFCQSAVSTAGPAHCQLPASHPCLCFLPLTLTRTGCGYLSWSES